MNRLLPLLILILSGCSTTNMLAGQGSYNRNWYAYEMTESIDNAIADELRGEPPNGHKTKPNSFSLWNEYWNRRIFYTYELCNPDCPKSYKGPNGPEFVRYILESRRSASLPELRIEERNRSRVP